MRIHHNRGFSLIEVLVAIAIWGVAVTVLLQAFVNTLTVLDHLETDSSRDLDLKFIRNNILQEADLDTFEEGGEITTLNMGTAHWEAEVEPTSIPNLFEVLLTIEFEGTDVEIPTIEETIYVLRPTWSDPLDKADIKEDIQKKIEAQRRSNFW